MCTVTRGEAIGSMAGDVPMMDWLRRALLWVIVVELCRILDE